MRKILTSVLGVAGLLAVVLALASSPASAAKDVITVSAPSDSGDPTGVYTVSWETLGGCDPGSGTSGASGSVSLTVTDATVAATATSVEDAIVIDTNCNYEYKASFVSDDGAVCTTTLGAESGGVRTLTEATGCATMVTLTVTIAGGVDVAQELCTQDDLDNDTENCDDAADTLTTVKVEEVRSELNDGAVAASTFTVTATPVGVNEGDDPHDDCAGDSDDAEVAEEGQPNQVTLSVVDGTPGETDNCRYDVSVALLDGFEADSKGSTVSEGVNPTPITDAADDDSNPDTPSDSDDNPANRPTLTVKVSQRHVFLVQRVHGDSGGASATYELAGVADCSTGGLPGILKPSAASGGISTVGGETVVELRTGAFNISGALTGNHDSGDPMAVAALDAKGNACEASVSISGVPAHCTVQSNSPANLATSDTRVIIGFDVDCRAPEPEPEPDPEPMDDTGDMGGDDMGADDMGADDMGGDDMGGDDMGGDDMGDMGPPEDVATG